MNRILMYEKLKGLDNTDFLFSLKFQEINRSQFRVLIRR